MIRYSNKIVSNITCHEISNDKVSLLVCPEVGGKIVSLRLLETNQELLWNNPNLKLTAVPAGTAYDPNFFGGIDELLPNDEKETIEGCEYLDHGELWTTPLKWEVQNDTACLTATLALASLWYEKKISLDPKSGTIHTDYVLRNLRSTSNPILWKLHAAMSIHPNDRIICPAKQGDLLDENFANRHGQTTFAWPNWKDERMDIVPSIESKKREFFYLSHLDRGEMRIESDEANTFFEYQFDPKVFPYAWVFATYGGWNGLYTAVLEPCSAVPHVLSKSIANKTCAVLLPNEEIRTRVTINVGKLKN